jgi:hypothetical protein
VASDVAGATSEAVSAAAAAADTKKDS